jgi:hypothetical protein
MYIPVVLYKTLPFPSRHPYPRAGRSCARLAHRFILGESKAYFFGRRTGRRPYPEAHRMCFEREVQSHSGVKPGVSEHKDMQGKSLDPPCPPNDPSRCFAGEAGGKEFFRLGGIVFFRFVSPTCFAQRSTMAQWGWAVEVVVDRPCNLSVHSKLKRFPPRPARSRACGT